MCACDQGGRGGGDKQGKKGKSGGDKGKSGGDKMSGKDIGSIVTGAAGSALDYVSGALHGSDDEEAPDTRAAPISPYVLAGGAAAALGVGILVARRF